MAVESIFKVIYERIESLMRKEFGEKLDIQSEYPSDENLKKLPALFIEMVSLDREPEPMTGEVELRSRWELRLVVSGKQPDARFVCRDAVARIAAVLHDKVLSPDKGRVMPARFTGANDDNFDLKVSLVESWVAEFEIVIRVGDDSWTKWEWYEENLQKP